jgi:hypothetical protein
MKNNLPQDRRDCPVLVSIMRQHQYIRNGTNKCGHAQHHCRDCGVHRVLRPKERYTAAQKAQILRAYREWVGCYTRKSLSFSKEEQYMDLVTRWFILEHNLAIQASPTI